MRPRSHCGVRRWASGVSSGVTLGAALLLMAVRARVRAAYSIQPSCCGPCDDLCCGFFCLPLATCQVLRHLRVVQGTRYAPCSPTGCERPESLVAI